jgi:hypothetical protein
MKATIDIDESLYRQLKIEAARSGRTIRELVAEGLRHVLGWPSEGAPAVSEDSLNWIGGLRKYAANAGGKHDMAAIRQSVAKRRPRRD